MGTDLLPAASRPKQVKEIALDASRAGVPVFARHGKTEVKSLLDEFYGNEIPEYILDAGKTFLKIRTDEC